MGEGIEEILMYYLIRKNLVECSASELGTGQEQFVAVLTAKEWERENALFDMGIDLDLNPEEIHSTKIEVNYDSLTGCFSIPDREHISSRHFFSFALDEKGIVLIDDTGYALSKIEAIQRSKKWRMPSLERFLYDFLEMIIGKDLALLEKLEHQLNHTEEEILRSKGEDFPTELNQIRGDLIDLRVHYEQLIDFGQELEENENGFFQPENLRFFRLFTERVIRLQDTVSSLRDYVVQLRDLVQSELDVHQNKIMTLLTVVTSIFLPLTLIAGWYGMNFRYMPELEWKASYPVVILVSILIVVVCLVWFKKKKWL